MQGPVGELSHLLLAPSYPAAPLMIAKVATPLATPMFLT